MPEILVLIENIALTSMTKYSRYFFVFDVMTSTVDQYKQYGQMLTTSTWR